MAVGQGAQDAFARLIGMGYSPAAAAGIVGNLVQESGPNLNPRAVHDNGTGLGIAGWRDPEPGRGRRTDLLNFASSRNADAYDLGTQLAFLDHELKTKERGVYERLLSAQTPDEAATAFISFERPRGWTPQNPQGGDSYQQRVNYARALAGLPAVAAQNTMAPARGGASGIPSFGALTTGLPAQTAPQASQRKSTADLLALLSQPAPQAAAPPAPSMPRGQVQADLLKKYLASSPGPGGGLLPAKWVS